ncbi:hypothetical protein AB0D65_14950 [Streptomyces griseoloalbus]|uniref:Lipoprotein n=1 Tax=Streptomyces griseoloalbus TaxID=67303 RepID=A0ABV3E572_9ACTN
MSRYRVAGSALALLALAGCGSSSDGGGAEPTTAPATTRAAEDKAALAAAPTSMESAGGAADDALCFTTNRDVLTAAADGFPAEGEALSLVGNGGVQRFPTGLSLTVSYLDTEAGTAGIAANCAAVPVAAYEDVRVGDPVEFAGVPFKVSEITERAVRLTRTSA